jgi:hypothetical protein
MGMKNAHTEEAEGFGYEGWGFLISSGVAFSLALLSIIGFFSAGDDAAKQMFTMVFSVGAIVSAAVATGFWQQMWSETGTTELI